MIRTKTPWTGRWINEQYFPSIDEIYRRAAEIQEQRPRTRQGTANKLILSGVNYDEVKAFAIRERDTGHLRDVDEALIAEFAREVDAG